jgi:hypothetical protein
MKKVYRIEVGYFCQKDNHQSIEGFVVCENDLEVYKFMNENLANWDEQGEDKAADDWREEGYSFKEEIIKSKGDLDNEDTELTDLYYGLTLYRWVEHEHDATVEEFRLAMGKFILNEGGETV